MPPLLATPEMLQIAQNDKPEKTSRRYWWSGHSETVYIYQYPLHMRCLLQDGILKVSFYSVDSMRMGANASLYDLYIDKASGQFLTWNANEEKWQRSKLDRLEWPKSGKATDAGFPKKIVPVLTAIWVQTATPIPKF